jgi:hypothetical protein
MGVFIPTGGCRSLRYFSALLWGEIRGAGRTTLEAAPTPQRNSMWVFTGLTDLLGSRPGYFANDIECGLVLVSS